MSQSRRVPETEQEGFSFLRSMPEDEGRPGKERTQTPPNFLDPSPERIFVGELSLGKYLEQNGFGWVVRLREWIFKSDWSPFVSAYTGMGRKAVHPGILMGLIVYGMLQRQWSLRDLEKLARRDVGAWWICGGLHPDHSTIGKFISMHAQVLTETYFVSLTKMLVKHLNLSAADVAGDGTVVEAWGSRFKNLKAEALREAAQEARKQAIANGQDTKAAVKADHLEQAAEVAQQRLENVTGKGGKEDSVRVCLTEPDAMVQPLKNKARRPSYKPSVFANKERLIVGQALHPSNEPEMVRPMLEQHTQIFDALPSRLLLDGGYCTFGILGLAVDLDLDLLCSAGREDDADGGKGDSDKASFSKRDFHYDEQTDSYLCPTEHCLCKRGGVQVHKGRKLQKYQCDLPADCPCRDSCTGSKQGRTIIRYEDEPLKEAMRKVLAHPKAREKSRRRKWMVEPVFSVLQDRQGLRKFHRRGVGKVKVEFALHCVAYNLGRALRLESQAKVFIFCLFLFHHEDTYALFVLLLVF
jgi:transposase